MKSNKPKRKWWQKKEKTPSEIAFGIFIGLIWVAMFDLDYTDYVLMHPFAISGRLLAVVFGMLVIGQNVKWMYEYQNENQNENEYQNENEDENEGEDE